MGKAPERITGVMSTGPTQPSAVQTACASYPPCTDCAIERRCSHTCGCLNWQSTSNVNTVSPVLCRSEQMLVRIADEIGALLYRERDPHFLHKHYNPAYSLLSLLEEHVG
jgi:uncharacterized protein